MKVQDYGELARIFTDAGATFDMAFNMAAPIHWMLLSTATGLAFFSAVFGVSYATIGKIIGHNVDAGGVYRAVIIVSILLIPYDTATYYQEDYVAQHGAYEEKFKESLNTVDITFTDNAAHRDVSAVLFYYHRLATFITTSLIDIVTGIVEPDDESGIDVSEPGTGQLPAWVFEVWHAGYASYMSDTKPFYDLWTDYIRLCTPVAVRNSGFNWQQVGLLGGINLGSESAYSNTFSVDAQAVLSTGYYMGDVTEVVSMQGTVESVYAAELELLQKEPLIMEGVSAKRNGYYVPSQKYWIAKSLAADSPLEFIDNPYDDMRWTPMHNTSIVDESFPKEKAFFPSNCKDMYRINSLAFTELKAAIGVKSNLEAMLSERETQMINGVKVPLLSAQTIFATSMANFGASSFESKAVGAADSLLKWWQGWKLLFYVPMLFGAISIAYSFMIMIFPIIAGFAVLPGRGSSLILYAHVLAYIHLVVFLLYFILKIGGMMLLGMSVTLSNGMAGGIMFTRGISAQAMALETVILMAVVGIFPIAYFLIFSDKAGLKGLSSKGLDAAGNAAAFAAKAAGAAMLAGKLTGVNSAVSGAVGKAKGALTATPKNPVALEAGNSASKGSQEGGGGTESSKNSSGTLTKDSGSDRKSWSKSSNGGNRQGSAIRLAEANAVASALSKK